MIICSLPNSRPATATGNEKRTQKKNGHVRSRFTSRNREGKEGEREGERRGGASGMHLSSLLTLFRFLSQAFLFCSFSFSPPSLVCSWVRSPAKMADDAAKRLQEEICKLLSVPILVRNNKPLAFTCVEYINHNRATARSRFVAFSLSLLKRDCDNVVAKRSCCTCAFVLSSVSRNVIILFQLFYWFSQTKCRTRFSARWRRLIRRLLFKRRLLRRASLP